MIFNAAPTMGPQVRASVTERHGTAPYAAPPVPVSHRPLSEDVLHKLDDDVQNEKNQLFTHLCLLYV